MTATGKGKRMKSIHMGVSVRGAIGRLSRSRAKMAPGMSGNGRPLTRVEAIDALMNHLAAGQELLPLGDCDLWDYKTGCPGHVIEDDA